MFSFIKQFCLFSILGIMLSGCRGCCPPFPCPKEFTESDNQWFAYKEGDEFSFLDKHNNDTVRFKYINNENFECDKEKYNLTPNCDFASSKGKIFNFEIVGSIEDSIDQTIKSNNIIQVKMITDDKEYKFLSYSDRRGLGRTIFKLDSLSKHSNDSSFTFKLGDSTRFISSSTVTKKIGLSKFTTRSKRLYERL